MNGCAANHQPARLDNTPEGGPSTHDVATKTATNTIVLATNIASHKAPWWDLEKMKIFQKNAPFGEQ